MWWQIFASFVLCVNSFASGKGKQKGENTLFKILPLPLLLVMVRNPPQVPNVKPKACNLSKPKSCSSAGESRVGGDGWDAQGFGE